MSLLELEPQLVTVEVTEDSGLVTVVVIGLSGPQGPPGTLIEVEEDGVVEVTPLRDLDFGTGFDVSEPVSRTARIDLDLSEVSVGGELGGTLDAPTVDASHSGSTHQSITDALNAHEIDAVDAHAASAIDFTPTDTIVSANAQAAIVEALTDGRAYTDNGHVLLSVLRGAINGVAELDADGKVPAIELPALAFGEVFVVASEAAMLALAAASGDIAVRTDTSQTFILSALPASTLANWVELLNPGGDVTSVNGRTGAVTGLEEAANKGAISGYAALDGSGYVPDAQINPDMARDTEVADAIGAHTGDPTDAHAGTAIEFTPAGRLTEVTVQAVLEQVDRMIPFFHTMSVIGDSLDPLGVVDSSPGFQAVIDSCIAAGGGIIAGIPGSFRLDTALDFSALEGQPFGVSFQMAGKGRKISSGNYGGTTIFLNHTGGTAIQAHGHRSGNNPIANLKLGGFSVFNEEDVVTPEFATTIYSASNGETLPIGSLYVDSVSGMFWPPACAALHVETVDEGVQTIRYTTMSDYWFATTSSLSNGQFLGALTDGKLHVDSTANFPASGTIEVFAFTTLYGGAWNTVTYTSKEATAFLGCSGGTGMLKSGLKHVRLVHPDFTELSGCSAGKGTLATGAAVTILPYTIDLDELQQGCALEDIFVWGRGHGGNGISLINFGHGQHMVTNITIDDFKDGVGFQIGALDTQYGIDENIGNCVFGPAQVQLCFTAYHIVARAAGPMTGDTFNSLKASNDPIDIDDSIGLLLDGGVSQNTFVSPQMVHHATEFQFDACEGNVLTAPMFSKGGDGPLLEEHRAEDHYTTIAAGSNGVNLAFNPDPRIGGTINVASTAGFPTASKGLLVPSSAGTQRIEYTGVTSTSFTGCIGGQGTMTAGDEIRLPTTAALRFVGSARSNHVIGFLDSNHYFGVSFEGSSRYNWVWGTDNGANVGVNDRTAVYRDISTDPSNVFVPGRNDPNIYMKGRALLAKSLTIDSLAVSGIGTTKPSAIGVSDVGHLPEAAHVDHDHGIGTLQNLLVRSAEFDNGTWVKNGASPPTITANLYDAPNGEAVAADRYHQNSPAGGNNTISQVVSGLGSLLGRTFVASVYLKGIGTSIGKTARIRVTDNSSVENGTGNSEITLTADWQRVSNAYTFAGVLTALKVFVWGNSTVQDEEFAVWGAQLEEAPSSGTYVPTVAAAFATRVPGIVIVDTDLYRSAVDTLKTDDSLVVSGSLSPSVLILPAVASPAETVEGSAVWDTDDDHLTIGTGAGRKTLANSDDITSGVSSFAKSGSTPLTGAVTISGGSNVTLTQTGQDVSIAANTGTSPSFLSIEKWGI